MFSSKFAAIFCQNVGMFKHVIASWSSNVLTESYLLCPSSLLLKQAANYPLICIGSTKCYSSSKSSSPSQLQSTPEPQEGNAFSMKNVESVLKEQTDLDKDMPICNVKNPYEKPHKKCILCQYDIEPDYKNVKLLSQFVSPYTGRIFGRHVTGLCIPMQRRVSLMIKRARRFGFMPLMFKESEYLNDPALFDPFKRVKNPEL